MQVGLQVKFHPWARRRHNEHAKFSHYDGSEDELSDVVTAAMQDKSNVSPGSFPNTFVVMVKPDKFFAPGERHLTGTPLKPQASEARVVVWSAQALAAENDRFATQCQFAIVSLRAAQ